MSRGDAGSGGQLPNTALAGMLFLAVTLWTPAPALAQAPDEIVTRSEAASRRTAGTPRSRARPAPPIPDLVSIKPPKALVEEIARDLDETDAARYVQSVFAYAADINNDRKPEIFIVSAYGCGASNCAMSIYRKTASGYELLMDGDNPQPQAAFTNGYRNIAASFRAGVCSQSISLYKFDGRKYQLAECYHRSCIGSSQRLRTVRVKCEEPEEVNSH